jgi:hypothetical protein
MAAGLQAIQITNNRLKNSNQVKARVLFSAFCFSSMTGQGTLQTDQLSNSKVKTWKLFAKNVHKIEVEIQESALWIILMHYNSQLLAILQYTSVHKTFFKMKFWHNIFPVELT